MEPLTPTQKKMLDFIKSFYKRKGYMPSYKEIGEKFGIKVPSVWEVIKRLEKKGWIERKWNQKRWMELV